MTQPTFNPNEKIIRRGLVEGKPVSNLILDTGATRTLVRSDLLPTSIRMEGEVTIRCAHGDTVTYPLAQISKYPQVQKNSWCELESPKLSQYQSYLAEISLDSCPSLTALQIQIQRITSSSLLALRRSNSKRLNKNSKKNPAMPKSLDDQFNWHKACRRSLCAKPLLTLTNPSLCQERPKRKNQKSEATEETGTRSSSRHSSSRSYCS